jgi:hypothetical protein
MSKTALRVVVLGAVVALLGIVSYAVAGGGGKHHLKPVTLEGYQENPDISTTGTGAFEARIADDDQSISYTLSYSGLEGTVMQSHIHFGKPAVTGGISIWLCYTTLVTKPPAPASDDLPVCPQSGEITGVLHPNDVVGPTANLAAVPPNFGQGIEPGAFAEILAAIRAGHAYANVHSTKWPGGEIRAQINDKGDKGKHGDD